MIYLISFHIPYESFYFDLRRLAGFQFQEYNQVIAVQFLFDPDSDIRGIQLPAGDLYCCDSTFRTVLNNNCGINQWRLRISIQFQMQRIGLVTFNAWAVIGYEKVFWRDAPVAALWPQLTVLGSMTLVGLIVARVLARRWESV